MSIVDFRERYYLTPLNFDDPIITKYKKNGFTILYGQSCLLCDRQNMVVINIFNKGHQSSPNYKLSLYNIKKVPKSLEDFLEPYRNYDYLSLMAQSDISINNKSSVVAGYSIDSVWMCLVYKTINGSYIYYFNFKLFGNAYKKITQKEEYGKIFNEYYFK